SRRIPDMDPTEQVFESEATPLQRGLYADIRRTFRAPIVNSIWRTLVANEPELAQYIWGQVKPVFQTREFAAFTVAHRNHIIATVESDLPEYDPADLDIEPAAFTELREQLATFDIVSPRLVVLFSLLNRRLNDRPVGTERGGEPATAPFPQWLDSGRGRPPTMVSQEKARSTIPADLAGGFGEMVPSVYRCLAQWPPYLERADTDLRSIIESEEYTDASRKAFEFAETYLDRLPYTPRVDPDGLANQGAETETIEELRDLFETFLSGAKKVLPLLHIHAATVGAAGERRALTFP
ncbi:MAG: halocarboxylic acid dehydrogenase DehI family protein, partial [Natronomonas sp.]